MCYVSTGFGGVCLSTQSAAAAAAAAAPLQHDCSTASTVFRSVSPMNKTDHLAYDTRLYLVLLVVRYGAAAATLLRVQAETGYGIPGRL